MSDALKDGSSRHKLVGGPYAGITVRTYGTDPIPFTANGSRPACTYTWGEAQVGQGKRARLIETFICTHEEGVTP